MCLLFLLRIVLILDYFLNNIFDFLFINVCIVLGNVIFFKFFFMYIFIGVFFLFF